MFHQDQETPEERRRRQLREALGISAPPVVQDTAASRRRSELHQALGLTASDTDRRRAEDVAREDGMSSLAEVGQLPAPPPRSEERREGREGGSWVGGCA